MPLQRPGQLVAQPAQMLAHPLLDPLDLGLGLGVLTLVELVVDAPDVVGLAVHDVAVDPGLLGGSNQTRRSTGRSHFQWMSAMT